MRQPAALLSVTVLAAYALPAFAADCRSLATLEWLLGEWVADGDKSVFHESWTARGSQTWEGKGSETSKAVPADSSSEDLRLVGMKDGVFYIAKVSHNPLPVAFRLSECEDGHFAFVNSSHDFPKRLDYVRQGDDKLQVRVSDGGGEGFTLDFVRTAMPVPGPEAVLAAEDARFAAMIAVEPEALRRWLAEDLAYVHSTGRTENREQLIDALVSGRLRYLAIEPSERQVSFQGPEVAIVQGVARIRAEARGQAADFPARYLAVYRQKDGAWQLHAWQSLRLP